MQYYVNEQHPISQSKIRDDVGNDMTTNGVSTNGAMTSEVYPSDSSPNDVGILMELCLQITDQELYDELNGYQEGEEREKFAQSALKIGAIALRQAQGRIDTERVRQEGKALIQNMSHVLDQHQQEVTGKIGDFLKDYFDPESGRFNERVQRLVGQDGELERVIRAQVEGDGSRLAQTLTTHVGKESPIMRVLDPEASTGVINQFSKSVEKTLSDQQERILREFSMDNGEGALTRLVKELNTNHGEVGKALQERIDKVTGEFSLDKEDSALSRLMKRVEHGQHEISNQFSLDQEGSALTRMRNQLLEVIEKQNKTNAEFQTEVKTTLAAMTAQKEEAKKGTQHGSVFEDAVFDFINERSQRSGDIATHIGNTTGLIQNNKKGDVVLKLGPEHAASGAQIVVEAKEDDSYTLSKALSEIDEARKNRGAGVGLFVFSNQTQAAVALEPLARYGNDIIMVWDAEDPATNVVFDAGLSVSRALCVRPGDHGKEVGADFKAIETAILEIEKQASELGQITKWTTTIKNNADHILKTTEKISGSLATQIETLNGRVGSLREAVSEPA